MSLFKYFSEERGLDALRHRHLLVTPPKYFNDPFEFSPLIKCKAPALFARRKFAEIVCSPEYFNGHRSEFPAVRDFAEFKTKIEHRRDQLLKEIAAGVSQVDRNTQDQILELLSESFGVICFAGDGLHALMWAHYTDSHRGLAIQFSENDPLFSGPAFMRMEYSDERVTYDASDLPNRAGVESFVRRKSSDWGYEKESRLVLRLQEMVSANTPEGLRYFLPISPTLIVSVTLGLRASDDLQHEVKTLLAAPAFQHVSVFRVRKDDNKPEFCLQRL